MAKAAAAFVGAFDEVPLPKAAFRKRTSAWAAICGPASRISRPTTYLEARATMVSSSRARACGQTVSAAASRPR